MCNLRSGNLSFPHAPLASQQRYCDVPWCPERESCQALTWSGFLFGTSGSRRGSFETVFWHALQWSNQTVTRRWPWHQTTRDRMDWGAQVWSGCRERWGGKGRNWTRRTLTKPKLRNRNSYSTSSNRYANVFGLLLGHVKLSLPPPRSSQIGFSWPKYVPLNDAPCYQGRSASHIVRTHLLWITTTVKLIANAFHDYIQVYPC